MEITDLDLVALERSAEFEALVRKRRRFVVPALACFATGTLAFLLLSAYARDFMASSVAGDLSVGYVIGFAYVLLVWGIAALYLRRARREWDPAVDALVRRVQAGEHGTAP